MLLTMPRSSGKVHVVRVRRSHLDKQGRRRDYESVYLRRTFRDGARVRNETVANLSMLPAGAITAIEATLKGQTLIAAGSEFTNARSLPHGHVAAVAAIAHRLGFPALLGPACLARDLVFALIISRVIRPASKLDTLSRWGDTTLGVDLGVAGASTDEIYAAMDWLADRQDAIERKLAAKHLGPDANPHRLALFDLSSSWVTGRHCELAAHGYSRDGKKGCEQIEYGVLTDPEGRPVAVRVVPGDTADPEAFTEIVGEIPAKFAIEDLVLVGDRGMITTARIKMLRELNENPDTATDFGWITALRAPAIAKLAAADGPLQMSLFDTQDLAEIAHPDYPDERLIACRNPALADERARKRDDLLAATDKELARIKDRVGRGTLSGAAEIGKAVGKVSGKSQGGQALPHHHYRHQLQFRTQPGGHRRRGPPRRHLRTPHQRHRPTPSMRPGSSMATRSWPTSNAISASSKPTTSTCGPSTTASTSASAHTGYLCLPAGLLNRPGNDRRLVFRPPGCRWFVDGSAARTRPAAGIRATS